MLIELCVRGRCGIKAQFFLFFCKFICQKIHCVNWSRLMVTKTGNKLEWMLVFHWNFRNYFAAVMICRFFSNKLTSKSIVLSRKIVGNFEIQFGIRSLMISRLWRSENLWKWKNLVFLKVWQNLKYSKNRTNIATIH